MILELILFLSIISIVSLLGVFTLSVKNLDKYLDYLVSLSIGALLGGTFIHLLPELAEEGIIQEVLIFVLSGIILFFILEKFIFWHHCHKSKHAKLCFSYMNLVGDALHNFLDGVLLAGAFLVSIDLGIVTGLAIFLHEVPQEIGDFGVLLKGNFTKKKALLFNFLISLTSFLGAGLTILFHSLINGITPILVAITAGGFIYIAGTDLIPELHKNPKLKDSIFQLFFILIGIGLMFLLIFLE